MADVQKAFAKLPPMEHTFDIQVAGNESGVNWVGKFKYKRPSLGARSRIDVMRARLNGDLDNLSQDVRDFNEAVAHLRYTLEDFPDWWRDAAFGLELYDGNVISEVYNKCMDFEESWKAKVFGGDAKAVEVSDDPLKHQAKEIVSEAR